MVSYKSTCCFDKDVTFHKTSVEIHKVQFQNGAFRLGARKQNESGIQTSVYFINGKEARFPSLE
eukprot:UN13260